MNRHTLNRHTGLALRNGMSLKNRVVVPPMASGTATVDGKVTPETESHYARLAESGSGLVFVEYTYVHLSGRSEALQLGIQSDAHIPGLKRVAEVIRHSGAIAGIQLTHAGGKTELEFTDGRLMGPSDVIVPVKDRVLGRPTPMNDEDLQLWRDSFASGVTRAAQAGFDLVEFHAAHGYGLNQWLSPITNPGRTLTQRAKLLLQIIADVKEREPNLLISVRMPGQDFMEGGLSPADSVELAKLLETAGVDFIDVSSGIGGWRRPMDRRGEGYLVAEAQLIQREVTIPVIGVGGIEHGAYIDQALHQGWFALAAVGRAILKDPILWRQSELNQEVLCLS